MEDKEMVRRRMRQQLKRTNERDRRRESADVCRWLAADAALAAAPYVALFAALPRELDLAVFAAVARRRGQRLYYPRYDAAAGVYRMAVCVDPAAMRPGYYGIPEPGAAAEIADDGVRQQLVWLVSGLAFDRRGVRLGRGGGYYDRLLAGVRGARVGIAFDWQIVDRLPAASFDVPMTRLCAGRGFIDCLAADAEDEDMSGGRAPAEQGEQDR